MLNCQVVLVYITVLIIIFTITGNYSTAEAPSTLRLAHIVFRHGDRSPTRTFPTDKHQEQSWPQGFGQLTQLGMRQQFTLGTVIRRLYGGFLNDTYIREEVYMRSTDTDRTLMSASMCLAGLYPPIGQQAWNQSVRWQPIPVHTVNLLTDNLLADTGSDVQCAQYSLLLRAVYQSAQVATYRIQNKEFLDLVRHEAGLPNADLSTIMDKVPNSLLCEKIHNLALPKWVTTERFQKLQDLKNFQMKLWFYTPEMQRIRAGVFLHELVNHTREKVLGNKNIRMKAYLYSAHDTTLAAILTALNVWDGLLPAYSSALMFELHQRQDHSYFVRLLYKNDSTTDAASVPVTLPIRGCVLDCNLERFYEVIQPMVYDGDWFKGCAKVGPAIDHFSGVPLIAIAVCVILLVVVAIVSIIVCYRKKSGGVAYQSANFTSDTNTA